MEKRKRNILIVILIAIQIGIMILRITTLPHIYTAKDKVSGFGPTVNRMYYPGIEFSTKRADVIVEGRIVADLPKTYAPKLYGEGADVKHLDAKVYKVRIKKIWAGDFNKRTVVAFFCGYAPYDMAPRMNDKVITFLKYDDYYQIYHPVDGEFSTFIINPNGTLFSLAEDEESAQYDGKLPYRLKKDVQEKIAELAADKKIIGGEVLKKYREENKTS